MRVRSTLLAALAVAATAPAADPLPAGNYFLWYAPTPVARQRLAVVKVAVDAGKPAVTVVHTGARPLAVAFGPAAVDGGRLTLPVEINKIKLTFEGTLDPAAPAAVAGSLTGDGFATKAGLEATDKDELAPSAAIDPIQLPPEWAAAQAELAKIRPARVAAARASDPADKAKKQADLKAVEAGAVAAAAAEYRKLLAAHPDSAAGAVAAEALLGAAAKIKPAAAEVATWVQTIEADAAKVGPRYAAAVPAKLAVQLAGVPGLAPLALTYAERAMAVSGLSAKAKAAGLKVLAAAQDGAGKPADAAKTRGAIEAAEVALDAEYKTEFPPLAVEKAAGRGAKAGAKVAVVELFTGAQCPPCVAADVAFDALLDAYPAADVVLLQYHLHIPGPDPLTTPDAVGRFEYYGKKFADDFGGTPATAFNGKPAAGGGGGRANAPDKLADYRKAVDKTLAEPAAATVSGTATRAGDTLTVQVAVGGLKDPADKVVVRLVLAEDVVRYQGGNGLRFHHHVVRGFVGTAAGVPVKDLKDGRYTAAVDVAKLKADQTAYLAEYAASAGFPTPDRPLAFAKLKVFALIQDDATGEILQAAGLGE